MKRVPWEAPTANYLLWDYADRQWLLRIVIAKRTMAIQQDCFVVPLRGTSRNARVKATDDWYSNGICVCLD